MQKIYTYNGVDYQNKQLVRQAIWDNERIAFPDEPVDESEQEAFWASYGVTLTIIPDPIPSLTQVKEWKLEELEQKFTEITNDCGINSSVGFKVNADITANRNVDMLIRYFPTGVSTVQFCDYNNVMRDVTKEQLETIMLEIVLNAQYLYQQKWNYRDTINASTTQQQVIDLDITFVCKDFS